MNKQVLIKLAQVRLAINYVLRNRVKQAAVDRTPTIPVWDFNPYDNGDKFYMNNGTKGYYYRSAADMEAHAQNPNLRTRPGTSRDTYVSPVQQAGNYINQGILEGTDRTPGINAKPPMPPLRSSLPTINLQEPTMPEERVLSIPKIAPSRQYSSPIKATPLSHR